MDPVGPDGRLMKLGPHQYIVQQLGLTSLEQQLQDRLLWDPVVSRLPGIADEMHNFLGPSVAVARCSFCSVWDWPCGSSHEPAAHLVFLFVPECIACGFAEGLQCGLGAMKPEKEPTAEHLGLPVVADEEQEMWLLDLQVACNKDPGLSYNPQS